LATQPSNVVWQVGGLDPPPPLPHHQPSPHDKMEGFQISCKPLVFWGSVRVNYRPENHVDVRVGGQVGGLVMTATYMEQLALPLSWLGTIYRFHFFDPTFNLTAFFKKTVKKVDL